ncbi:MAG: vWA domain-containing protein [Fusobacteriaceae bacterium]
MSFGNLKYIWLLVFPIGICLIAIYGMRKKNKILSYLKLYTERKIEILRVISYTFGGIFLFVALLSPQKLIENAKQDVRGTDVYILFDTSNSMLAEDIYPNRLEQGKKAVGNILNQLKGDRIGLIPFSDSAYVQMPLTDDYEIAKNYLNIINTDLISGGGTELLSALKIANKSFEETLSRRKVVLIISDGGEEEKEIEKYINENNITVFSIGLGTLEGSSIPIIEEGIKKGFIKNNDKEVVVTKLNSEFMKKISKDKYYEINNLKNDSNKFIDDFLKIEREKLGEEKAAIYKRYFQIPLLLGVLFILLAYFYKGEIKIEK